MKKYVLILSVMLFSMTLVAQSFSRMGNSKTAKFNWQSTIKDFGEISQGQPVETIFEFTNDGTAPLVISNVRTSCGCTASDYTSEPIMPGESGKITVTYNASAIGVFSKTITVNSNANEAIAMLKITGTVE